MSKFVRLISNESLIFQKKDSLLNLTPSRTTDELSKACEKAAKEYGPSFFKYLSKKTSNR